MKQSMDPRIPFVLCPQMDAYSRLVAQHMPGRILGIYLEGSIALDSFNPRLSDVDFLSVLSSPPTPGDFENLQKIHQIIERQYPRWKLEGNYFHLADLGCPDDSIQPFLCYHEGKLRWRDRFILGSVTWWILKQHGIAILGPPSQTFAYTVDMADLIQKQRENLNSYWDSWTTRPTRILALLSDWTIQWTVLGILRQFYTFHEHQITSKVKAGEYALLHLPARWHLLVQEAIALRAGSRKTYYRSRVRRAYEAYAFLDYVIKSIGNKLSIG